MISIGKTRGFDSESLVRLQDVVKRANTVLLSDQFKIKLCAISEFPQTADNGKMVYLLLAACDQPLNLGLYSPPWYKRWSSAIARENPDGSIDFRFNYFLNATTADLVGTLIHELCHKVGYVHDFWNTPRRPLSVPYRVGDLAALCCSL